MVHWIINPHSHPKDVGALVFGTREYVTLYGKRDFAGAIILDYLGKL